MMIEVGDERRDGALEVDVVLPERVVCVDEQGLSGRDSRSRKVHVVTDYQSVIRSGRRRSTVIRSNSPHTYWFLVGKSLGIVLKCGGRKSTGWLAGEERTQNRRPPALLPCGWRHPTFQTYGRGGFSRCVR